MKAVALAGTLLAVLAVAAGAAGATVHRPASLRALSLTPPTFRGSGFKPREGVSVTLRGAAIPSVHTMTDARGRFRVRLAGLPACRAWTVRALGVDGGLAVYHHARCASLNKDVKGVVQRGPIKNLCVVGVPCSAPAVGVTVQALQSGRLVAETTTDKHGRFSFSLADGAYTIKVLGRGTEPKTVQVRTSNAVHLAFLIDTGIR